MSVTLQRKLICFLTIILGHINSFAQLQKPENLSNYQFQHLSSIEGLSNNTVYSITQGPDGYMWIATSEGLNKYDGFSITTFYHRKDDSSSLPSNYITQLFTTSTGVLLVGTRNGLCYWNPSNNTFTPITDAQHKSFGNIIKIIELSDHNLMISAFCGVFTIDKNFNSKKIHDPLVEDICLYKNGVLWASAEDKIILMNKDGEIIKTYQDSKLLKRSINKRTSNIHCIFKDSRGIIWLGTVRNGLGYYDPESDDFKILNFKKGNNAMEDNFIRTINEDKNGNLWIGTESGLYIYNVETKKYSFYGRSYDPSLNGLNDKAIYSIYKSKSGMMWIGTYFGGLNYTMAGNKKFYSTHADGGVKNLSGGAVSELIETKKGDIWIASEDGGISIFNPKNKSYSYLKHDNHDAHSLSSNNVHALAEDDKGNVWIGTFIGGLNKYNSKSGKIDRINLEYPGSEIIQNVFAVLIDTEKTIWVGAISGLYNNKNNDGTFKLYQPDIFMDNFIYSLYEDANKQVWIGTYSDGIYRITPNEDVSHYTSYNTAGIQSNFVTDIIQDSNKNLWFSTFNGGLTMYCPQTQKFNTYTIDDGLPNNSIYAVTEDHYGNIWCSSNKGISVLYQNSGIIKNFNVNDGLIGNQYNYKSALTSSDGMIYLGAVNGLTYFDPSQIKTDSIKPVIHFTDLKIFNQSVKIGDNEILKKQVDYQKEICLKYRYKAFTIEYVALNFLSPNNVEYEYLLDGFDDKWNSVGSRNYVSYTNLSPGTYVFRLKATNGNGIWSEERNLTIKVLPPFWLSIWGYLLYAFLLTGMVGLYLHYNNLRNKTKLKVQLASIENKKNQELSQHRLNFFTYISHEFKTPLTLIITTIEHFMEHEDFKLSLKGYGTQIKKNAMRLLFLINQLMDFRKIETDHALIQLNKGEVVGYIKSIFQSFGPLFEKKQIVSEFKSNTESYIAYFDADKIEKILTNLISNSCQSIIDDGKISLSIEIVEKSLTAFSVKDNDYKSDIIITVKDNGPGLPQGKIEQVYEPFYTDNPNDIEKSGIGLALVKSLVKFLGGDMQISSSPNKGITTEIRLPLIINPTPEYIKNDVFIEDNANLQLDNTILTLDYEPIFDSESSEDGTLKEYEILIVEDNKELANFLSHHFTRVFKTRVASNGKEGYEKAIKFHPDLIISDIMMPVMDGYALCDKLKDSFETSHIPIILLTAKFGENDRLEGLHKGADAYLSKPFNLRELDLNVKNIIKGRENIKQHFLKFNNTNRPLTKLVNKDQKFLEELTEIIQKHIDDPRLTVEKLCEIACISRTLIHLKLKKLTSMSTTEFIKSIRLGEARKLLEEGSLTVSEVAYKVGFNDPDYFRRSFKKIYSQSPSEFKKSSQDKKN